MSNGESDNVMGFDIAAAMKLDGLESGDVDITKKLADSVEKLVERIGLRAEAVRILKDTGQIDVSQLVSDVLEYQYNSLQFYPKVFSEKDITAVYNNIRLLQNE